MKQLLTYISILIVTGALFQACDVVEEPYVEENASVWNGRKILILDFTGHHCPNCPEGHRTLEELQNSFGEAVVPVAIHATYFARFQNDTTEPFYYDFTCPAGIELGGNTQGEPGYFSIFGLPVAAVNTLDPDETTNPGEWGGIISGILGKYPEFTISIDNDYNAGDNILNTEVETEVEVASVRNLRVAVYLTESHIINWQEDDAAEESPVPDYQHNHVLRAGMNGTFGEDVNTGNTAITPGDLMTVTCSQEMGSEWQAENCHVVAFIYDTDTYEVLQAETSPLIQK